MTDRKLNIGGTYRHCKGGLYTVLGTLTPRQYLGDGMGVRTELYGGLLCASDILEGEESVVYQNATGTKLLREKANFLAVLGKPTSQYYRFEEVVK